MRRDMQDLLARCREGREASLTFEAEGTAYTRRFQPGERLIVLGAGHVSQALCRLSREVGFSVTVVDDRPEFASPERFPGAAVLCGEFLPAIRELEIGSRDYVAILTRGHRSDMACLRAVLSGRMPRYLGMIGSRKRVGEQLAILEEEGFSRQALGRVHTPIGLPIGAVTVPEIAVSIAAQLIQCRRDTPRKGGGRVLAEDNVDPRLMDFLAGDTPKALIIVYESSGSTPGKPGAMMAVDRSGAWAGTVGGGMAEHMAMEEAVGLIGTGRERCCSFKMTDHAAAEEGMACGGRMKVWITDLG